MISILICGYNPEHERKIRENIPYTVGCEHEILYYKNIEGKGICEVYNLLSKQAKGSILCFIHEDIEITTINWGVLLQKGHEEYDIIGVAGGKYKTKIPSVWSTTGYYCLNITQYFKYKTKKQEPKLLFHEHNSQRTIEDVVCIDGVFMSMKRSVIEKISFDSVNFKRFHGYDYDFCINAFQFFKLGVIKTLHLIHYSEGENNKEWMDAQITIYNKWKHILPIHTSDMTFNNKTYFEFLAYKQCIYKMNKYKYLRWDLLLKLFKIQFILYGISYIFNRTPNQKP